MSLLGRALGLLLIGLPAVAQPHSLSMVTIKPAHSGTTSNGHVQLLRDGTVVAKSISTVTLLSYAYDVPVNGSPQLTVLPDWTVRERYDIEARSAAAPVPPGLPDRELRSRMKAIVRDLLAERFKLVVQVKHVRMPVYALTTANGGLRLERSALLEQDCISNASADCHNFTGGLGHPLNATAIDIDDIAHYIANWTDLPVVNRTRVDGLFRVHTEGWVPMRLPPPPPNGETAMNPFAGLPTIFAVLGKLGLELNRQEDILPVYTVEHIERPAIN